MRVIRMCDNEITKGEAGRQVSQGRKGNHGRKGRQVSQGR